MTGMRSNTAAIYLRKSTEDDSRQFGHEPRPAPLGSKLIR